MKTNLTVTSALLLQWTKVILVSQRVNILFLSKAGFSNALFSQSVVLLPHRLILRTECFLWGIQPQRYLNIYDFLLEPNIIILNAFNICISLEHTVSILHNSVCRPSNQVLLRVMNYDNFIFPSSFGISSWVGKTL